MYEVEKPSFNLGGGLPANTDIERQKERFFASELGGHINQERINCEVGDAATLQKQRLALITRVLELGDCVFDILPIERILQLTGEKR